MALRETGRPLTTIATRLLSTRMAPWDLYAGSSQRSHRSGGSMTWRRVSMTWNFPFIRASVIDEKGYGQGNARQVRW